MKLTDEQRERIDRQRAWVAEQLPRELRKARSSSRFERMGNGQLKKKSSSARRWVTRSLHMRSITSFLF
ncbi:hypothetical protein [Paraburkholderia tropica]|uniref:hypothetical protein n=1 Tax=Paraburkholderia tropica TaxID=92647 RepID=UPI001F1828B1|nr:hypothetical protein [Paraburkholderia tropica]MDE1139558.1 hypothetical protein [Paraburkholderia tropica]